MKTHMSKLLFTMTIVWTAIYGHGCATTDIYIPPVESVNNRQFKEMEISTTLKPYVSMFIEELDKRKCSKARLFQIKSIELAGEEEFLEQENIQGGGYYLGLCFDTSPNRPYARILIRKAANLSIIETMSVVFHELGHCALGLDHVEVGKGERAIMSSMSGIPDTTTPLEWEQMKNELFKECEK